MEHIKDDNKREIAIKGILNSNLSKKITVEALKEHGVYQEMESWFNTIKDIYCSTANVLTNKEIQMSTLKS
jgi:hypothetical protein